MILNTMARPTADTLQIGLRIEKEILDKVEKYSKEQGIDKMTFIRTAIANYIDDIEQDFEDFAVEDFVNLRIGEKELKNMTAMRDIPNDLQEARKDVLNKIKNKAIKK